MTSPTAVKTPLHFARFEFKYVLPAPLADALERELGYFMGLDPFLERQPDKLYFVRSLYYDDAAFTSYYEKIDGLLHRYKFRIRTYTPDVEAEVVRFLEIKGRHNMLVFKHRVPLTGWKSGPGTSPGVDMSRVLLQHLPPGPVRDRFEIDLYRKGLRPVMLIDYRRRPYVSKYDPELRVTFDRNLRATPTVELFPGPRENSRAVLPGMVVLEVKFRHHMPAWFHHLIQFYELRRVPISKVCKGIDAWNLTPHLE